MAFDKQQLQAGPDTAISILRALGADEQGDLVDAWQASGNVAAIAAVAREDDAPAPGRKAARRAVNVLRSRGVTIPEARSAARPFQGTSGWTTEARFLAPDASGDVVLSIMARAPGRDARLVDVVLSPRGISRASVGSVAASRLREWEKTLVASRGFGPVAVDLAWARSRVKAGAAVNEQTGLLLPLELANARDLLDGAPDATPAHPLELAGMSLEHADAEAVKSSGALHNQPEFVHLLPSRAAIDELLRKLGERVAASGEAEPSQATFSEFVREECDAATDRFFTPDLRDALAASLLDAALSVHARLGADAARQVLATRTAISKCGLVTDPPRDVPFLRAFFDKAIALLLQSGGGQLTVPLPPKPAADAAPAG